MQARQAHSSVMGTKSRESICGSSIRRRRCGSGPPHLELVNGAFLEIGGTPDQFRAALVRTISLGWLWRHESGTYVNFTLAGAEMFA
jgi:hypothetical protein